MKTENMSTARARLATYRARHAAAANKSPRGWRGHKYVPAPLASASRNSVRGKDGQIFTDGLDQYGAIVDENKNGFYADSFCDGVIRGAVVRMRTPRGALYIPCTYCTGWEGTVHYLKDAERVPKGADESAHDEAKREALRSAEYFAEREADEAREDDARQQAEFQIEQARETITESRQCARALAAEIRALSGCGPAVRAALRDRLQAFRDASAKAHARIISLSENYWTAVE